MTGIHRVLVPGGRVGLTVWGHLKQSPGVWALQPFRLASTAKVANQASMVSLGRPGVGEELLSRFGFVMNASRLWAYQPALQRQLFGLLRNLVHEHGLTFRQRGILVAACASTLGDSYCSVAWGTKLARATDEKLAKWARKVTRDPNHTTSEDVESLRTAGPGRHHLRPPAGDPGC